MRLSFAIASLAMLAACQTLPAVVDSGSGVFDVRYDQRSQTAADADARAARYCGAAAVLVSPERARFDGLTYRTYRCAGR